MKYINIHTHKQRHTGLPAYVEVINQYPSDVDQELPYFSIGIHPWYIDFENLDRDLQQIAEHIKLPNCIAVGECGLDKRIELPLEKQLPVFEKQLIMSQNAGKPVIIHCVAAFQEVIQAIRKNKITVPVVIHGFSKSRQLAEQLLAEGYYLSFGKYLLRNPQLEKVFLSIPTDRYFLETDSIDEGIDEVYALAASYRKQSVQEISKQLSENFQFVFKAKAVVL